ncbi:MAG TPA: hypothetical protein EYF98_05770 [Planctomycetes bacterium]|nr:hypothetical protein [Planctomycetota bacterium]
MSFSIRVLFPQRVPLVLWIRDDDAPTRYGIFRCTDSVECIRGDASLSDVAAASLLEFPILDPDAVVDEDAEDVPERPEYQAAFEMPTAATPAAAAAPAPAPAAAAPASPEALSPISLVCTWCEAPEGRPCVTDSGNEKDDFHKARQDDFDES